MDVTISVELREMELEADLITRIAVALKQQGYNLIVIKGMKRRENQIEVLADAITLN